MQQYLSTSDAGCTVYTISPPTQSTTTWFLNWLGDLELQVDFQSITVRKTFVTSQVLQSKFVKLFGAWGPEEAEGFVAGPQNFKNKYIHSNL